MGSIIRLHHRIFSSLESMTQGWFLPLAARFVFLGVIFFYYLNSAMTKVGEGIFGFFQIQSGAYFQIVPFAMEVAEYDVTKVPFHWDILVWVGTYMEFLLPILIVIGLFTRLAALGMIGFIAVQTWVDIQFHGVDDKTLGSLFDRFPESLISDQRTLWVFVLLVLVIKGGGTFSLDRLFARNPR